MSQNNEQTKLYTLPMIALRGVVLFPQMTLSLDVERELSVQDADFAAKGDHLLYL